MLVLHVQPSSLGCEAVESNFHEFEQRAETSAGQDSVHHQALYFFGCSVHASTLGIEFMVPGYLPPRET